MNTKVDNLSAAIAGQVRIERERRGWSLADLAERSGVSKAAISKIERGEASPTAVNLVKLASAFGLTLAAFLSRAEGAGAGLLSRATDRQTWRDPETGYVRRQAFVHPDHPVEMTEVCLPQGQRVEMPAASYARIRQVVLVTDGALTIIDGQTRTELTVGDCLGLGAIGDIVFVNETARPCTYLVVLSRM